MIKEKILFPDPPPVTNSSVTNSSVTGVIALMGKGGLHLAPPPTPPPLRHPPPLPAQPPSFPPFFFFDFRSIVSSRDVNVCDVNMYVCVTRHVHATSNKNQIPNIKMEKVKLFFYTVQKSATIDRS